MKFETRGKPSITPFSNPLPEPNNTVSMKMPQNTPNAVSDVRSLCWLSVLKISRHFSRSMSIGSVRSHRGHESGENAHSHQQRDGGHGYLEVHFRIHEVRHLGTRAA